MSSESIKTPESIAESDIVWRALKTNKRQHVYLPNDIKVEGVLTDFFPRDILVEPILYKDLPIGVIILPGASVKDSYILAERLRHQIEDTSIHHGTQTIHVTVSIGISSHPECNAGDTNTLLKYADEALYSAKESGRNCIVVK